MKGSYLIGNFESFQEGHKLLFDVRLLWGQNTQIVLKYHLLMVNSRECVRSLSSHGTGEEK